MHQPVIGLLQLCYKAKKMRNVVLDHTLCCTTHHNPRSRNEQFCRRLCLLEVDEREANEVSQNAFWRFRLTARVNSCDVCVFCQAREADLYLHRVLRKHFQVNDEDDIDFEMFDNLIRKIAALANAFTGMETMQTLSIEQADMLLEHRWPGASAGLSKAAARADMIKRMLGKGTKKIDPELLWVSPFGSHFPNPRKKKFYSFYHATYCPETGKYQDEIFEGDQISRPPRAEPQNTERNLWNAISRLQANG